MSLIAADCLFGGQVGLDLLKCEKAVSKEVYLQRDRPCGGAEQARATR
jgi:hypothetical protein